MIEFVEFGVRRMFSHWPSSSEISARPREEKKFERWCGDPLSGDDDDDVMGSIKALLTIGFP